jgi:hypothetical protein
MCGCCHFTVPGMTAASKAAMPGAPRITASVSPSEVFLPILSPAPSYTISVQCSFPPDDLRLAHHPPKRVALEAKLPCRQSSPSRSTAVTGSEASGA